MRPHHSHTQTNPRKFLFIVLFCVWCWLCFYGRCLVSLGAGCDVLFLRVVLTRVWLCLCCLVISGCLMLCALTGHSAGSIWGPVCSLQCPWSDTVPNRPQLLWQKGLAVLHPQQGYVKELQEAKLLQQFTISSNSDIQVRYNGAH